MKVQFKQPRCIDGVHFQKGTHEVPDSLASHWYLLACIQNGTASIVQGPGAAQPVAPPQVEGQKKVETPAPQAPSYHEHMKQWESKEDKKVATQEEADKMVASGEAQIPADAVVDEKKAKRQEAARKAAATRAAKKASSQGEVAIQ